MSRNRVIEELPGGACNTCTYLHRRRIGSEMQFYCTWFTSTLEASYSRLYKRVDFCTARNEHGQATLRQMREDAWYIRTDKGGKAVGFTPYRSLDKKLKEKYDDEELK